MIPTIPTQTLIPLDDIPTAPDFQGLRIIRFQTNEKDQQNFTTQRYQFQHDSGYTSLPATVAVKGMVTNPERRRVVATVHPNLKDFVNLVMYDPANPPRDNYVALGVIKAHEQTQSDFKGQKEQNRELFRSYLLEGVNGDRTVYLPTISGWQTSVAFPKTVFVAFDESNPYVLYGRLYLPKMPILQADGQTQTAALFALANTRDAVDSGALEHLNVTLEIELNVAERQAGQSFADRNGRGSKKNRNLVIGMDSSSALSELRLAAVEGTIFEKRLATGRNTSTSETATGPIVDLSTMEQMLLFVVSDGKLKQESFKHHHVKHFLPYAKEFLKLLEELFGADWVEKTPKNQEPFRRLYVHGWPFVLKALASAYHRSRLDQLKPLLEAMNHRDAGKTAADAYASYLEDLDTTYPAPAVDFDELKRRLEEIDWRRYRAHWVKLAGPKLKAGKKVGVTLKGIPEPKVLSQAQNTNAAINAVRDAVLGNQWKDLTKKVDEQPET